MAENGAEAAACRGAEATDATTGLGDLRDPHVLLDIHGQLHLEPLSRRYLWSELIKFPGRPQWMPPALKSLEEDGESVDISMLPEARTSPLSACSLQWQLSAGLGRSRDYGSSEVR